jgi:hypothetical protein
VKVIANSSCRRYHVYDMKHRFDETFLVCSLRFIYKLVMVDSCWNVYGLSAGNDLDDAVYVKSVK